MTSLQTRLSTGLILALVGLITLAVATGGYSLRRRAAIHCDAWLKTSSPPAWSTTWKQSWPR